VNGLFLKGCEPALTSRDFHENLGLALEIMRRKKINEAMLESGQNQALHE